MRITGNDPHGGLDRENLADSLDQRRGMVDHDQLPGVVDGGDAITTPPVVGSLVEPATHEDQMEPALSAAAVGG